MAANVTNRLWSLEKLVERTSKQDAPTMNRTSRIAFGALIGIAVAIADATLISAAPPRGVAELIGFCVPWAVVGAAIAYFVGRERPKASN
jgi:hypothetical protein